MTELYKKLAKVREYNMKVVKSKDNPFLKSKYSDLNSVLEVSDPALHEAGLLWQDIIEDGFLISSIIDIDTGEKIESKTPLLMQKQDSQALGSAISYNRRYNRLTMLGMQTIDEDGNTASGATFIKPAQIKKINELILETKTDAQALMQHYRISAIKDLHEHTANDVIKTLTLKKEKGMKNEK